MSLLQLRFLTLSRGVKRYKDWIARTIGWAVVVYMAVWSIFYLVAGIQLALRDIQEVTILIPTQALAVMFGCAWLGAVFLPQLPQVILNRRDIIRLALTPILPTQVLAWGFWQQRIIWGLFGTLLGGFWWLFTPKLFGFNPLFAPLCLALGFASVVDWRWLRYCQSNKVWIAGVLLSLAILGDAFAVTQFFSSLYTVNFIALGLPILLWFSGFILVKYFTNQNYPTKYFYFSNILSDTQAMQVNAFLLQRPLDMDSQRRRLSLLSPKGLIVRTLASPPQKWGAFGAMVWRVSLTLYRRSIFNWLRFAVWLALLTLFHHSLTFGIIGLGTIQIWLWRSFLPQLLCNVYDAKLPIAIITRTLGSTTPGILIIFFLAIIGLGFAPAFATTIGIILLRSISGLLLLEKFCVWLKLPPDARETSYAAATLCFLPSFLSGNILLELGVQLLISLIVILQKRF